MKKNERIEALKIAKNYDIKVIRTWWNPYQNVSWQVLRSKKKLSDDQYYYLSNNKLLKPKEEIKEGEEIVLTISDLGLSKLAALSNGS
jgi:hypothetical protein